ncbi:MAG: NAD+ synthase [bacterium]
MSNLVIEKIVNWLLKQLQDSKTSGFILGLSGGLDSAVCAALMKRVTDNCLGLIMPIESALQDIDDASRVADALNMRTEYTDLTSVYGNLTKLLPGGNQVALGNIKARLRMVVLYYYANLNNYLVCGTGNKTELMLGYFTKYGDGACDILPLGDLYKYEVHQIAETLNIPKAIIEKTPSAGLWRGQTDEGEIGFPYGQIDKTLDEIDQGKISGICAEKLHKMIEKNVHKRRLPLICSLK